jgi:hypothetical protein
VFDENALASNPEKLLYVDFVVNFKSDQAIKSSKMGSFDLRINVVGKEDPMNPEVFPKQIRVVNDKEQKYSIQYNCKKLLDKTQGNPYFDTVRVILSDPTFSNEEIIYEYMVVCDPSKLGAFDINFLVLFGIAVGIIVLAIKTPPLLMLKDMTEEE